MLTLGNPIAWGIVIDRFNARTLPSYEIILIKDPDEADRLLERLYSYKDRHYDSIELQSMFYNSEHYMGSLKPKAGNELTEIGVREQFVLPIKGRDWEVRLINFDDIPTISYWPGAEQDN